MVGFNDGVKRKSNTTLDRTESGEFSSTTVYNPSRSIQESPLFFSGKTA